MNRSLYLLTEGLFELHQLANEARQSKPLLYEGLGYSNFDIVLMEAEDQPGFLTRAADAVKKLSKASKTALVELDELANGLPTSFANSQAAIAKAQRELKTMSADAGLGKIWSMMKTVSIKKLYSGDDQSLEKIAEITSDMVRYQQMVSTVYANVKEQMSELPETVDPESLKGKPMNTWSDMPGMEDLDGIDEAGIKKAIATAAKPAKWFSGLKALGGSLGIGFGGDLPFKRYGLNGNKLLADFMGSTPEQLEEASTAAQVEPDDQKVASGIGAATQAMGQAAAEQEQAAAEQEKAGKEQEQAAADGEGSGEESGSSDEKTDGDSGGDAPAGSSKFLTVIKGVPGIRDPESAADKLEDLLAAGYVPQNQLFTESLTSLLLEKNVRYNDIVNALRDHLPEDEAEIPAAVKALSDEMKVELGSEFGVVGIPDSTSADIQALKAEIAALRAALDSLPDDKRAEAEEQIKDNLVGAGATEEEAADIVNADVPVDTAAADVDAEDVDKIEAAAEKSADAAEAAAEKSADAPDEGKITSWFKKKAGDAWAKTKDTFGKLKDNLSAEDMLILAQAAGDPENAEAQKKAAAIMKRVAADQIKGEAGEELGGVINNIAGIEGSSAAEKAGDEKTDGEGPAAGDFYEYTTNKGKTAGYKVAAITDEGMVQLARPKKDLTGYTKNVFAVSADKLGKKLSDEAAALSLAAKAAGKSARTPGSSFAVAKELNSVRSKEDFTISDLEKVFGKLKSGQQVTFKGQSGMIKKPLTGFKEKDGKIYGMTADGDSQIDTNTKFVEFVQQESFTFSGKDRLTRVAVARMRGYILNETNNFRYSSSLSPKQVVQEFYSRGGTNKDITPNKKQSTVIDRWHLLAGLNDE